MPTGSSGFGGSGQSEEERRTRREARAGPGRAAWAEAEAAAKRQVSSGWRETERLAPTHLSRESALSRGEDAGRSVRASTAGGRAGRGIELRLGRPEAQRPASRLPIGRLAPALLEQGPAALARATILIAARQTVHRQGRHADRIRVDKEKDQVYRERCATLTQSLSPISVRPTERRAEWDGRVLEWHGVGRLRPDKRLDERATDALTSKSLSWRDASEPVTAKPAVDELPGAPPGC